MVALRCCRFNPWERTFGRRGGDRNLASAGTRTLPSCCTDCSPWHHDCGGQSVGQPVGRLTEPLLSCPVDTCATKTAPFGESYRLLSPSALQTCCSAVYFRTRESPVARPCCSSMSPSALQTCCSATSGHASPQWPGRAAECCPPQLCRLVAAMSTSGHASPQWPGRAAACCPPQLCRLLSVMSTSGHASPQWPGLAAD
jgi:hypothetical protein